MVENGVQFRFFRRILGESPGSRFVDVFIGAADESPDRLDGRGQRQLFHFFFVGLHCIHGVGDQCLVYRAFGC